MSQHRASRSGPPSISHTGGRLWGSSSSAGGRSHPSLTPGMLAYGVHVWSRHLSATAGPQPPLADRGENAPLHMRNASGIAAIHTHTLAHKKKNQAGTCTHTHLPNHHHRTLLLHSGAPHIPTHFRQVSGREVAMASMLDPPLADETHTHILIGLSDSCNPSPPFSYTSTPYCPPPPPPSKGSQKSAPCNTASKAPQLRFCHPGFCTGHKKRWNRFIWVMLLTDTNGKKRQREDALKSFFNQTFTNKMYQYSTIDIGEPSGDKHSRL